MTRAALVLTVALPLAACGWTPADEQVLRLFFDGSRVYDTTMLAPIARVTFDPRTDGVVERFEIVSRRDGRGPGGVLERELTVDAQVRSAAGVIRPRTLLITAQQSENAWIVTRVR